MGFIALATEPYSKLIYNQKKKKTITLVKIRGVFYFKNMRGLSIHIGLAKIVKEVVLVIPTPKNSKKSSHLTSHFG